MMSKRKDKRARWPLGPGRPTLGPAVCAWMEANLVHAEGDYFGKPFGLRPHEVDIVHRAYELAADGTRRYDRVLVGMGKGGGKTELAAALAVAEFCGPVVFTGFAADGAPKEPTLRVSPDIPVAAASFDQANLVFGAARTMLRHGRLAEFVEIYETEVLLKGRPGRLYRVPAVAGTNEGARPTFFVADELHEWTGNKERVYLVLQNGRAKRRDGWQLAITTAGWDPASLLGTLYAHGRRVQSGEEQDPRFLFIWYEAAPKWDLSKPEELEAAIREANPAAGDYLPIENIIRQYRTIPESEFRRYHLNQFTAAPEQWIPPEVWAAAARPDRVVADETPIVLGFDGSYNRDSTALVGCTLEEPYHLFVVNVWERPAQAPADWSVPRADVLDAITAAHARYKVQRFAFDDTFGGMWALDLEGLAEKGVVLVKWETRSQSRMGPAAGAFYGALKDGRLTHDGDPRLAAHVAHAIAKGSRWGLLPTKETPDSTRRIDLLIAGIIAFDMAQRAQPSEHGPWLIAAIRADER